MAYYHWARRPVTLLERRYAQLGHPKPNGFWFDVDGEWKRWCDTVRFHPERLRYRHAVTLVDASRILFLKRPRDIDNFTRRYGRDLTGHIRMLQSPEELGEFTSRYGRDLFAEVRQQFAQYIMWGEVAKRYAGIIVHPYSPSRSLTYLWYYGWNCAGGCVWDTSVIRLGRPRKMQK